MVPDGRYEARSIGTSLEVARRAQDLPEDVERERGGDDEAGEGDGRPGGTAAPRPVRPLHARPGRRYATCSTAAVSSETDTAPSNFDATRPSRPTTNTHGSLGRLHSLTQRFTGLAGSLSS